MLAGRLCSTLAVSATVLALSFQDGLCFASVCGPNPGDGDPSTSVCCPLWAAWRESDVQATPPVAPPPDAPPPGFAGGCVSSQIRGVAPCSWFQVNDLTFERNAKRTLTRAPPRSAALLCILRRADGFRAGASPVWLAESPRPPAAGPD